VDSEQKQSEKFLIKSVAKSNSSSVKYFFLMALESIGVSSSDIFDKLL
jgi:hypothetical protein